jgi:predicted alpha/beta-fold hydrolase
MDDLLVYAAVALRGLLESLLGLVLSPFLRREEIPVVTAIASPCNDAMLSACPALARYRAPIWAYLPYAQTTLAIYGKARCAFSCACACGWQQRELLRMGDGVQVALDWRVCVCCCLVPLPKTAPLVVVMHGLGANSSSAHERALTAMCHAEGWRSVVYVRRGHGGTSLLPAVPADAEERRPRCRAFPGHADMEDAWRVVQHIRSAYPGAPMIAVGMSAGANLVVKFQGVFADRSPFVAAVSVSNGHDIAEGSQLLADTRPLADRALAACLKSIVHALPSHEMAAAARLAGVTLDLAAVRRSASFRDVEQALGRVVGGYALLDQYFRDQGCWRDIEHVRAPLLSLASKDDPLIPPALIRHATNAATRNPHVVSVVTRRGGHVGWLQPRSTSGSSDASWIHTVLRQYIHHQVGIARAGAAPSDAGAGAGAGAAPSDAGVRALGRACTVENVRDLL